MRQRATCLLAVVLGVTIISAQEQAPAPAIPHLLDHFKIWKVRSVAAANHVQLLGQFDDRWWDAQLRSAEFLGNPTNKTHGDVVAKIANPDLHLIAYSLTAAVRQPRRDVYFENQFTTTLANGMEKWTIGDPALQDSPSRRDDRFERLPHGLRRRRFSLNDWSSASVSVPAPQSTRTGHEAEIHPY